VTVEERQADLRVASELVQFDTVLPGGPRDRLTVTEAECRCVCCAM
jgi:hypothetical protein